MSHTKCLQCTGAVDHAPGGPFCKVIRKVAQQQTEISDLYRMLNEKNLMVEDILKTANNLQRVVDSLMGRSPMSGTA